MDRATALEAIDDEIARAHAEHRAFLDRDSIRDFADGYAKGLEYARTLVIALDVVIDVREIPC